VAFIYLRDPRITAVESPVRIRGCQFRGGAIGVRLEAQQRSCEYIDVTENIFRGTIFGVRLGPTHHLRVGGNRFLSVRNSAISMEATTGIRQVLLANNTFLDCNTALRLGALAPPPEVTVRNNLVLGANRPDWVFQCWDGKQGSPAVAGDSAEVFRVWDVAHNWREVPLIIRDDSDEGKAWVPPGPKDVRQDKIEGVNRDPNSPGFLRPDPKSPLARQGGETDALPLPPYVGALPPEGAEPWDWDRTCRLQPKKAEDPK
jgi:hypothetical protein